MFSTKKILVSILVLFFISVAGCNSTDQQTQRNNDEQYMEDAMTPGITAKVVATVDGEEITSQEITRLQQSLAQQGQEISKEDAIEQLINQEVLSQESRQPEFIPSDEEAEQQIRAQLRQQGATLEQFKQQLQQQGIAYEEQLDDVKSQIAIQNYVDHTFEDKEFNVTEEEARALYERYKQQSAEEIPPYEEVEPQLINSLEQQKQQQEINALIKDLKSDVDITYK